MARTSVAIAHNRTESLDSFDFFPTHPWGVRALCNFLIEDEGLDLSGLDVLEPGVGLGHLARTLDEYFKEVWVSDLVDWPKALGKNRYVFHIAPHIADFLSPDYPAYPGEYDWVITNPPFNRAKEFALKSFELCGNIALLCRTSFVESKDRYVSLFNRFDGLRPNQVLVFSERIGFERDRIRYKYSSAMSFAWMIWRSDMNNKRPEMEWVEPGFRDAHKYEEDYLHDPQDPPPKASEKQADLD